VAHYEITYIIRPMLEDLQVEELASRFSTVAKDNGADGVDIEYLGKKRMAYEIKKQRDGHYVCLKIAGKPDCAKEVVRQLRLHDDVLRALLIKV